MNERRSLSRKINNYAIVVIIFAWGFVVAAVVLARHQNDWTWFESIVHFWPSWSFVTIGTVFILLGRPKS